MQRFKSQANIKLKKKLKFILKWWRLTIQRNCQKLKKYKLLEIIFLNILPGVILLQINSVDVLLIVNVCNGTYNVNNHVIVIYQLINKAL